jgi:hypothetical protein
MKKKLSGILLLLICLVSKVTPVYAQTCTCTDIASGDSIKTVLSQTVCVNNNITAVVKMNGGTICVSAGDTLIVKKMIYSGGNIINNGTIVYDTADFTAVYNPQVQVNNGTIIINGSSLFVNYYTGTVFNTNVTDLSGTFILNAARVDIRNLNPTILTNNGNVIINADTTEIYANSTYRTIQNKGSFTINGFVRIMPQAGPGIPASVSIINDAGANFTINGTVLTIDNFRTTIRFDNRGIFTINGKSDFTNNVIIRNFGNFYIRNGHVNSAGQIINNSFFSISPSISFTTGQGFLTNHCKFLVADSLYITKKTYNNGLIWITNPNGILNIGTGGSFENTAKGKINGARFSNSGTVKGSGEFYFTGATTQQGAFAGSYNSIDSFINFYDVSNTSPAIPGSFFDTGIQGARVKRVAITAADTLSFVCNLADSIILPLPIKMYGFKAELVSNNVDLGWLTADEEKINIYEIQRSNTGADWRTIGSVTAFKAPGKNSYAFRDKEPYKGLNLYRIKAVSIDNVATYSETRAVNLGNATGNSQAAAYPNPAADKLNLVYYNGQQDVALNYQVTDLSGKVMLSGDWQINSGGNTHTVNVSALSKGIYLLKLINKNNGTVILLQKVVKN